MARKNVLATYKMIDAASLSGGITSNSTNVLNTDKASIHLVWSGAAGSATVSVQARNGEKDSWYDLDFGSAITISGASGDHQLVLLETPFTDIRVVIGAGATGTVTATLTMKQLGG